MNQKSGSASSPRSKYEGTQRLICGLEEIRGRAALLARTVLRDASLRFSLASARRMANYTSEDRPTGRSSQHTAVNSQSCFRVVCAFFSLRSDGRITFSARKTPAHAHHAVMPSISPAANRYIRTRLLSEDEKRAKKRQAESRQYQDGQELSQGLSSEPPKYLLRQVRSIVTDMEDQLFG
jgi:hypothetical protein